MMPNREEKRKRKIMDNSILELISTLKRLKAEIEWDYSLEYKGALEKAIGILQAVEKLNINSKGKNNE